MAGVSNWQNISYCIEQLRDMKPAHVLDVGAGFGTWGFLCRAFIDVWNDNHFEAQWKMKIDAIEAFENNISPLYAYIYDNVQQGDAMPLLAKAVEQKADYDVVILGDVLEHFEKNVGKELLENALAISRTAVMLNVPLGKDWPQGAKYGNEYERHRSVWEIEDFWQEDFPYTMKLFTDYLGRLFATVCIYKEETVERPKLRLSQENLRVHQQQAGS